ncbi:MAG: hypothetical protein ACTH5B_18320 [Marinomonas sp.]|uniref:hypothetical protein n=1 Tax=Marinomonas sp. TaxID=1904862 RepID=UPI003F9C09CF
MSIKKKTNKHIRATWDRFNKPNKMSTVTISEIKDFAEQRGLLVEGVEEVDFGYNPRIKAIQIKTNEGTALYPRQRLDEIDVYNRNIQPNQDYEHFWNSVDWFIPMFMTSGDIKHGIEVSGLNVRGHRHSNKRLIQERFEPALSSIYTLGNIVPITVQTLAESSTICKHLPIIKESILAFYSGMKIAAIAALIPIIEDILGSIIGEDGSDLDIVSKVNKSIDLANEGVTKLHINNVDWISEEYIESSVLKVMNERTFTLETIRYWLLNSFYATTDNYDNHSGFNRHFFAHAKSDIWQNEHNFFRAMGLIQALAFIECFAVEGSKVSIFPPEPDERAESFRLEVFACMNTQFFKMQILNKLQLENNLPFNPTASDDGWLLRASKLSEKMNTEIIPSLRDNEWQCHSFTGPIKEGEYISVNATKGNHDIKVALLYTCATSNSIYKELDKTCDYILYQGYYYKQDSYAYGVEAKVLPLSAWITPD